MRLVSPEISHSEKSVREGGRDQMFGEITRIEGTVIIRLNDSQPSKSARILDRLPLFA